MEQPKPRKQSRNVPRTDKDFDTLVTNVNNKWAQSSWLKLLWITQAQFSATVTAFTSSLDSKNLVASGRSGLRGSLEDLDKKIDTGERFIKNYLAEKYEANPEHHYPAFGIERLGNRYTIPHDRDARKKALLLIIPALTQFGFENKKYGLAYWQDIASQYATLMTQATVRDGAISTGAGSKNQHKESLKEVLNSIILNIKSNYPYTWKQELREWGFQKEKY